MLNGDGRSKFAAQVIASVAGSGLTGALAFTAIRVGGVAFLEGLGITGGVASAIAGSAALTGGVFLVVPLVASVGLIRAWTREG